MNKINVNVPSDIQYISEWKEYTIPYGHCIIDKGVTGCGFTEYCLTNSDNIILCSPRRLLLENKVEQHQGDLNILYLKNDLEKIIEYDDVFKNKEKQAQYRSPMQAMRKALLRRNMEQLIKENHQKVLEIFTDRITQHSVNCQTTGRPIKFLVTYDSFKYLFEILGENIKNYKIVIDEFQSIFMDAAFKPDTELDFSEYLQQCPNVCYLSATPMLAPYLDQLDDFKDLDMYVFIWSNYVEKALVSRRLVSSAYQSIKSVINSFLAGNFPTTADSNRVIHVSKEAVLYINSVTDIIKLVNTCGLTPLNTDIICADTEKNRRKLKRIGFTIAKPNTKKNRHLNKMFTFCTKTVYLGADFYSDNATTYVASNPNKEHLSLDIALDLPQILGRQRMSENPWKNQCTFFYQLSTEIDTEAKVLDVISDKVEMSNKLIRIYDNVDEKDSKLALSTKYRVAADYSVDYLGVSRKTNIPGINKYVWVSDTRFWQVTQQDYFDSINVRRAIESQGYIEHDIQKEEGQAMSQVLSVIQGPGDFRDKMRAYTEFINQYPMAIQALDGKLGTNRYSTYYNYFGPQKLRAIGYQESLMKHEFQNKYAYGSLEFNEDILGSFKVGEKYLKRDIKILLGDIYRKHKMTLKPKASDLEKWFVLKRARITNSTTGKQDEGFEIISIR